MFSKNCCDQHEKNHLLKPSFETNFPTVRISPRSTNSPKSSFSSSSDDMFWQTPDLFKIVFFVYYLNQGYIVCFQNSISKRPSRSSLRFNKNECIAKCEFANLYLYFFTIQSLLLCKHVKKSAKSNRNLSSFSHSKFYDRR